METQYSKSQIDLLAKNRHFESLSMLDDGDLLVVDIATTTTTDARPYVLTRDGRVQSIQYHYRYSHRITVLHPLSTRS